MVDEKSTSPIITNIDGNISNMKAMFWNRNPP